jgi:hypothetical protein
MHFPMQASSFNLCRVKGDQRVVLDIEEVWFALYNMIEAIHPASFAVSGAVASTRVPRADFLYFSLITLTIVGYGDIVPISRAAKVFSALEGVAGVMYIAIMVACRSCLSNSRKRRTLGLAIGYTISPKGISLVQSRVMRRAMAAFFCSNLEVQFFVRRPRDSWATVAEPLWRAACHCSRVITQRKPR